MARVNFKLAEEVKKREVQPNTTKAQLSSGKKDFSKRESSVETGRERSKKIIFDNNNSGLNIFSKYSKYFKKLIYKKQQYKE